MEKLNISIYDTIILDLDFTVWEGSKEHFWAKSLQFPIKKNKEKIIDCNGDYIRLYDGIKEFLNHFKNQNKNIGFITRGGLLNLEFNKQPCIICLKKFGIYKYFTYNNCILYKTDKKSRVLKSNNKTVFIDDNPIDLNDVKEKHPNVTVLNRNTFKNWDELI